MSNNLRRLISLIPIENDDKFFGVYHRNGSAKKNINLLIKKPLNLEISNSTPINYQLNYTLEKYGKRQNFLPMIPKINLKFNKEQSISYIANNIPIPNASFIFHKPIEDERSKIRPKISPKTRKLTINNIIFHEDFSKNNLSKSSSKHNIIYLERKKNLNNLQKKIIDKAYENEMRQFKIYSKNMNEMIANQMVFEFFKRTKNLQKLNKDDLMINYIQSNYYKRRFSTSTNTNVQNDDVITTHSDSPNLIIHNVFFEWAISNVIQRYINEINPINKNASLKFIRNILVNEVKTLSTIFFYKKKEKKNEKDLPRNMRIVRNLFGKYKLKHDNINENKRKKDELDFQLDIKREEIKQKLMEKIIEKLVKNKDEEKDKNKIENNEFNSRKNSLRNNKSIDFSNIRKIKKYLTKQNTNELLEENNENIKINLSNHYNIIQKVSVQTNTDSSLNTNYNNNKYDNTEKKEIHKKEKKEVKDKDEEESIENYGLFEPYYKYEAYSDNKKYKQEYRRNIKKQSIKDYIRSNKTESMDNSKSINYSKNSSPTPYKKKYRKLEPLNNSLNNRSFNQENNDNDKIENKKIFEKKKYFENKINKEKVIYSDKKSENEINYKNENKMNYENINKNDINNLINNSNINNEKNDSNQNTFVKKDLGEETILEYMKKKEVNNNNGKIIELINDRNIVNDFSIFGNSVKPNEDIVENTNLNIHIRNEENSRKKSKIKKSNIIKKENIINEIRKNIDKQNNNNKKNIKKEEKEKEVEEKNEENNNNNEEEENNQYEEEEEEEIEIKNSKIQKKIKKNKNNNIDINDQIEKNKDFKRIKTKEKKKNEKFDNHKKQKRKKKRKK